MLLKELAFRVPGKIEHSLEDDENTKNEFLKNGKYIHLIEGNKFILYSFDQYLGILTADKKELVAWCQFSLLDDLIKLNKIYVVKKWREQKISKLMVFWLKEHFKKSVIIGEAIFNDGEMLIKSLINDNRFDVFVFNIISKRKSDFDLDTFFKSKHEYMLIENWDNSFNGFYDNTIPGGEKKFICLELFGPYQRAGQ